MLCSAEEHGFPLYPASSRQFPDGGLGLVDSRPGLASRMRKKRGQRCSTAMLSLYIFWVEGKQTAIYSKGHDIQKGHDPNPSSATKLLIPLSVFFFSNFFSVLRWNKWKHETCTWTAIRNLHWLNEQSPSPNYYFCAKSETYVNFLN